MVGGSLAGWVAVGRLGGLVGGLVGWLVGWLFGCVLGESESLRTYL